jgi:hypothetical protein
MIQYYNLKILFNKPLFASWRHIGFGQYKIDSVFVYLILHAPKAEVFHAAIFGAFHPAGNTVARAVTIITQK